MEDGEPQSRAVPAVGLRAEQARQEARVGPQEWAAPWVSTQPVLVGDCGVLILTAVCTPMACGLPGMQGRSQCSSDQGGGGSPGAGEPRDRRSLCLLPPGPRAGLVAPGTPQVPRPFITGSPSVVQDVVRASGQQDGGQCASFLGSGVWPSFFPLPSGEKSL